MIKSVTVVNHIGEKLVLELTRPEESGLAVTSITGLGPVSANVNLTRKSSGDGARLNSSRLPERNIVITLDFSFATAVEDARQLTYRYFPQQETVTLLFETSNRLVATTGIVERNEPDIFSEQESTNISILCPDPYFYCLDESVTVFSGIVPAFEFPFESDVLDGPELEMGIIETSCEKIVHYEGVSNPGVIMMIHAVGDTGNITIYNTGTREKMFLDSAKIEILTGQRISPGDDIIITTVTGKKSVVLLREGVKTNILNALGKHAGWFHLVKGKNVFAYEAEGGPYSVQFTVKNQVMYGGI